MLRKREKTRKKSIIGKENEKELQCVMERRIGEKYKKQ